MFGGNDEIVPAEYVGSAQRPGAQSGAGPKYMNKMKPNSDMETKSYGRIPAPNKALELFGSAAA